MCSTATKGCGIRLSTTTKAARAATHTPIQPSAAVDSQPSLPPAPATLPLIDVTTPQQVPNAVKLRCIWNEITDTTSAATMRTISSRDNEWALLSSVGAASGGWLMTMLSSGRVHGIGCASQLSLTWCNTRGEAIHVATELFSAKARPGDQLADAVTRGYGGRWVGIGRRESRTGGAIR
jgi:hypothetical protein